MSVELCIYIFHTVVPAVIRRYVRRCDRNRTVSSVFYGVIAHHGYVLGNSYSISVKCGAHSDGHTVICTYDGIRQMLHILHKLVHHVVAAVVPVCSIIYHVVRNRQVVRLHAVYVTGESLLGVYVLLESAQEIYVLVAVNLYKVIHEFYYRGIMIHHDRWEYVILFVDYHYHTICKF